MTLEEKRAEWERGGSVELCVTHNVDGYKTMMVIVSFVHENNMVKKYQMLRYFKIGDDWLVSCDNQGEGLDGLEECMVAITTQFEDIRP